MSTIRAFTTMPSLAIHTLGAVSPFGVLTTREQTYTRESAKQRAGAEAFPNVDVLVFSAQNNAFQNVATDIQTQTLMLQIGEWVYQQYTTNAIPPDSNQAAFIAAIMTQFGTQITGADVGVLINGGLTNRNMPDFISYQAVVNGITWQIKQWFSGPSFSTQFDIFEIGLIPPVPQASLSVLNGNQAQVVAALVNQSAAAQYAAAEALAGTDTPTAIQAFNTVWSDPTGSGATLSLTWLVVGFGPQAFDNVNIINQIKSYLGTQAPGVTNWSIIFPGLYTGAEFLVVPMWDHLPAQYGGTDVGVYSAAQNVNAITNTFVQRAPSSYGFAGSAYVPANLELWPTQWRGMNLAVMGNPANLAPNTALSVLFPDYLNVSTLTTDYGRMTSNTVNFLTALTEALEVARVISPTVAAPAGVTTTQSAGRLYVVFEFGLFSFLILSKYSFNHTF